MVVLHFPASGQLQLFVGEHVEERHQVAVVLVALIVVRVSADLTDHVLQTGVSGEHAVGTLSSQVEEEIEKLLIWKVSPINVHVFHSIGFQEI